MSEFSRSNSIEFGRKGPEGLKDQLSPYNNSDRSNLYHDNLSLSEQMQAEADEINQLLDECNIPEDISNLKVPDVNEGVIDDIEKYKQEEHICQEDKMKILREEMNRIFG